MCQSTLPPNLTTKQSEIDKLSFNFLKFRHLANFNNKQKLIIIIIIIFIIITKKSILLDFDIFQNAHRIATKLIIKMNKIKYYYCVPDLKLCIELEKIALR